MPIYNRQNTLWEIKENLENDPDEILIFQEPTNLSIIRSDEENQIEEYVIKIHSIKIEESKHLLDFHYQTPPDVIAPKALKIVVQSFMLKLDDIGTKVDKGEYIRIKNKCQEQKNAVQRIEKYNKSLKGKIQQKSVKLKAWIKDQKLLGGIIIGITVTEINTIISIFTKIFIFIGKLFQ